MAVAEVTQSVGCPELRSLEKIQLCSDVSFIHGHGIRWLEKIHREKYLRNENPTSANSAAVWEVVENTF